MAELPQSGKERADEFIILGVTSKGRQFRPSDWAERLCGVMSCFRPPGSGGRKAPQQFYPYVHPPLVDGGKAVGVYHARPSVEPHAYHFVVNFAKDNDLQMVEACYVPPPGEQKPAI
jgi:hypothetical protein